MMKKAKTVEIPLDRALTEKEYDRLKKHAMNSAMWNATKYFRNSFEIRTKLRNKGFLEDDVTYIDREKKEHTVNIIDSTIEHLISEGVINDEQLANDMFYNSARSGKSIQATQTKMIKRRFPQELIEEAKENYLNENENPDNEALERLAERLVSSHSFQKLDKFKKREKLTRALVSKGISFYDVSDWINDNQEHMQ